MSIVVFTFDHWNSLLSLFSLYLMSTFLSFCCVLFCNHLAVIVTVGVCKIAASLKYSKYVVITGAFWWCFFLVENSLCWMRNLGREVEKFHTEHWMCPLFLWGKIRCANCEVEERKGAGGYCDNLSLITYLVDDDSGADAVGKVEKGTIIIERPNHFFVRLSFCTRSPFSCSMFHAEKFSFPLLLACNLSPFWGIDGWASFSTSYGIDEEKWLLLNLSFLARVSCFADIYSLSRCSAVEGGWDLELAIAGEKREKQMKNKVWFDKVFFHDVIRKNAMTAEVMEACVCV